MSITIVYPICSVFCFVFAIFFFRKKDVRLNQVLFPFLTSLYNPSRMKEHLKSEGIGLIIMGYLSFIVYLFIS